MRALQAEGLDSCDHVNNDFLSDWFSCGTGVTKNVFCIFKDFHSLMKD